MLAILVIGGCTGEEIAPATSAAPAPEDSDPLAALYAAPAGAAAFIHVSDMAAESVGLGDLPRDAYAFLGYGFAAAADVVVPVEFHTATATLAPFGYLVDLSLDEADAVPPPVDLDAFFTAAPVASGRRQVGTGTGDAAAAAGRLGNAPAGCQVAPVAEWLVGAAAFVVAALVVGAVRALPGAAAHPSGRRVLIARPALLLAVTAAYAAALLWLLAYDVERLRFDTASSTAGASSCATACWPGSPRRRCSWGSATSRAAVGTAPTAAAGAACSGTASPAGAGTAPCAEEARSHFGERSWTEDGAHRAGRFEPCLLALLAPHLPGAHMEEVPMSTTTPRLTYTKRVLWTPPQRQGRSHVMPLDPAARALVVYQPPGTPVRG